jgi:hypothetical protein
MTRTNTPDEDVRALNRQLDQNADSRIRRHKTDADAATRLDVPKEFLGAEISGEGRASDESETGDAIKRAAENDGRV